MMNKMNGTIESMGKDGKRFKLDDGSWYSAFASSQLPAGLSAGDYVTFAYVEKGEYRNIKGSVTKATPPASTPTSAAGMAAAGSASDHPYLDGKNYVKKMFPVPPLHPDRSIIRQNSLTHAVRIMEEYQFDVLGESRWSTAEEAASAAVDIARIFEAYSTGEADARQAEEEVAMALASEAYH